MVSDTQHMTQLDLDQCRYITIPIVNCGGNGVGDTQHIMKMVNNSVKKLYNGLILCLVSYY